MIISDLNHLEAVEGTGVVGGIANRKAKTVLKFYEEVDIYKNIDVKAKVKGRTAFGEADAEAYGKDAVAQFFTTSYVDDYGASGSATSLSSAS